MARSATKAVKKPPEQPANCTVGLPHFPADYHGKPRKGFLPWEHAEKRLVASRNYWICTARPDGRPHSAPVWGFWFDGALYFGTGRDTRKAKNLAHNPAVSIHLESGDDVVILEGRVEEVNIAADKALQKKLNPLSKKKYKMPLVIMPGALLYRVRPKVVLAWTEKEFPYISTRWEFH
jgi:pyridoxine/pyridoxamine 5'-phosphate oxidase